MIVKIIISSNYHAMIPGIADIGVVITYSHEDEVPVMSWPPCMMTAYGGTFLDAASLIDPTLKEFELRPFLTQRKLKPKTHEFSFTETFGMRKLRKQGLFLSFLIPTVSENENSWVFGFIFRCVRNGLTSQGNVGITDLEYLVFRTPSCRSQILEEKASLFAGSTLLKNWDFR